MKLKLQKQSIFILTLLGILSAALIFQSENKDSNIQSLSPFSMFIGESVIPLVKESSNLALNYQDIDWDELGPLQRINRHVMGDISKSELTRYEVFAESASNHAVFNTSEPDELFWASIRDKLGEELCLYIKITDVNSNSYFAFLRVGDHEGTYLSDLLDSNFIPSSKINLKDTMQIEAFWEKSSSFRMPLYSLTESVTPIYLTNDVVLKCKDKRLNFLTEEQDSIHVLIKKDNGDIKKRTYSYDTPVTLGDLISDHVEESTIFICLGGPDDVNRVLGVIVISDEQRLLAIRPTFLNTNLGFPFNNVICRNMEYQDESLHFVWGEVELKLAKNEKGDFFARRRIGRSQWNNTHLKKPNLFIGKTIYTDSLSFDLSFSTENLDTMNKVVFENWRSDSSNSSPNNPLPDSLLEGVAKNQRSIIRLEGIQNEQVAKANISFEIEIFDDSPPRKQKKYQFHWGAIDTTLTQKNKAKQYKETVTLSLTKFQSLFSKEPVLTSSVEGVVDEFSYEIFHYRGTELLASNKLYSNIKDAAVFLKSVKEVQLQNQVKVGDVISLRSFNSPELDLKDVIRLDISVEKDRKEDLAASIDDKNTYLEWGSRKFKTTQLGDQSRKKSVQDQVIDQNSLLEIIQKPMLLNKYGKKENIVHAEWFINEDRYGEQNCKEEENWKQCFANRLKSSSSGDFVSVFIRSSSGYGAICQFHIDYAVSDAIVGFGNTEFDSLLFKYSKQTYSKLVLPKYKYEFSWGQTKVPLVLKGNPNVYGGEMSIQFEELKDILEGKIAINSSDGEVISIQQAYLYVTKLRPEIKTTKRKYLAYDFDCENQDCAFGIENAIKVLDELQDQVYSVRVFINEHSASEEHIKVSFVDFIVEDDSKAWRPKQWIAKNNSTELFEFQFVYQEKGKTLVKLDKENEKYLWLVEKYSKDRTIELIDLPGFKTTQRAIYTKYDWGNNESIRNTQVLSKNYINGYALYDYYDLEHKNISFYWKGYESLFGAQSYCNEDFICAEGGIELTIGNQDIAIIRGDLIILPEEGPGYKFVFDDIDCEEIVSALKDLPIRTSLFFENLIVHSGDGESYRLPLKFAYHIE